jgi:hypothetical protein
MRLRNEIPGIDVNGRLRRFFEKAAAFCGAREFFCGAREFL